MPSGSQPLPRLTFSGILGSLPPPAEANEIPVSDPYILPPFDSNFTPDLAQYGSLRNDFRPSSAQSYSASEFSLSSTDMDNDSMSEASLQHRSGHDQIQGINLEAMTVGYVPPHHEPHFRSTQSRTNAGANDSVSPADLTRSSGPTRGSGDDSSANLERLERKSSGTIDQSRANRSFY